MPEIVKVPFATEVIDKIEHWLHSQIEYYEREHRELHQNLIPRWRDQYNGVPAEKNKSFPWPNASNVVVQVIGEAVDNAVARVQGLIWATHPLWAYRNFNKDTQDRRVREKRRRALEAYMDIVGNQPDVLDLYRVYGQTFTDTAKLGTAFVKLVLDEQEEAVVIGYEKQNKRTVGKDKVIYSGPRVEKLRHEDVMLDPRAETVEKSRLVTHRRSLSKEDLEERAFFEIYDRKAVEAILTNPDRTTAKTSEKRELAESGINPSAGEQDMGAEWDIYECYFPWLHNGHKYRLIFSYHKRTHTVLRKIFNFMPNNRPSIYRAKLGYREDGMYGKGYGYILERYQEEATSIHNRRGDNETLANLRMLRVSPRARTLDANFELYPGAILVGEDGDIESIPIGDVYKSSFDNESMTKSLVMSRTGITPAQTGLGTGGMQKRPAVYSSGGTQAVLQENNSVMGHATSEFRHFHVQVGDGLTDLYAAFGTNGSEKLFGENGRYLTEALKDYAKDRLFIPIRATTAAINREVDKQNAMIMKQLQDKHFDNVTKMLQAVASPMVPDPARKNMLSFIDASTSLMQKIMKDFDYDQSDEFVPDIEQSQPSSPPSQGGQVAPGQPPVGGSPAPPVASGGAMVSGGNGAGLLAGTPSNPVPAGR